VTFPSTDEEFPAVCQFLGLADDADSHATYATEAHRCYRLDNPTRIATGHQESYCLGSNHVECPVFKGENVAATATPPRAAAPPRDVPPPRGGGRPRPATAGGGRAERAPRPAGAPGPRPRPGGISIPVLTVGLFVLAGLVLGLALWLQSLFNDGDGQASPLDNQQTQQAKTAAATTATTPTRAPGTPSTASPGATTSATAANRTPGATTTGTVGPAGATYTVQPGDNCGVIAEAENVTVADLQRLNPAINAECTNLEVGQVLKLK
jgi:LysM repeat protein